MFTQAEIAKHLERAALRREVNGQDNGYKPVTEAELQAAKQLANRNYGAC